MDYEKMWKELKCDFEKKEEVCRADPGSRIAGRWYGAILAKMAKHEKPEPCGFCCEHQRLTQKLDANNEKIAQLKQELRVLRQTGQHLTQVGR